MKRLLKKIVSHFGYRIESNAAVTNFDVDAEFLPFYHAAMHKTGTEDDNRWRRGRHYVLHQLLKRVIFLNGNIAECGCFKGLSAHQIAAICRNNNFKNKFFIFDSFEGLSRFDSEDISVHNSKTDFVKRQKEFSCPMGQVKNNLKEFDFIDYKEGWIPSRFDEVKEERFSFVHIDVDMYQPIKDCIDFFYPRLLEGGIMVFDDYGYLGFPGAKKAVDEFLAKNKVFFLELPCGSSFIIKGH